MQKSYRFAGKQSAALFLFLAVLSLALLFVLCMFGSAHLSIEEVLRGALYRYLAIGEKSGNDGAIVNLRLMRTLMAYITGAALSASGACMQAVFGNPMAEPHVLGVSSGAALGAAIATVLGLETSGLGISALSLCAFGGAILAAAAVLALSRIDGRTGTASLLLAGIAMGAFLSALLSGLLALNREKADSVYLWTMGSFATATWGKIRLAAPVTALGCLTATLYARDLNVMLAGETDARTLGLDVRRTRALALLLSTLMTAVVVSMTGVIGFVGLMVPHVARLLVGPDHRRLLPACVLMGGIYLMCMDTLARSLFSSEIPVGVLTSLVGGPFFLFMLRKSRGARPRRGRRRAKA